MAQLAPPPPARPAGAGCTRARSPSKERRLFAGAMDLRAGNANRPRLVKAMRIAKRESLASAGWAAIRRI
jgi:hypothetical protein